MMDFFDERPAQSRAKHDILRRYAGAWSGIILNGLARPDGQRARRRRGPVHLVFVDGFAGAGRYERDVDKEPPGSAEEPVWGSPILGMRAIERQAQNFSIRLPVTVSGVLVEENETFYAALLENLEAAGLTRPIVPANGFQDRRHGTILAINGDFREYIDGLLDWIGDGSFALGFLDPFGPSMDLDAMRKLLRRDRTDLISLFPYDDLKKRGGSALKPEEDWGASDRGNITRFDAHFGTAAWKDIYANPDLSPAEREEAFVDLYTRRLASADPRKVVKKIGLRYAHGESRTAYYLCMATRNAQGALRFNRLIRETAAVEDLEIWRDREALVRRRDEEAGQRTLFDAIGGVPTTPPTPEKWRADPDDVERVVLGRGVTDSPIAYATFLEHFADDVFIESEIQQALRTLRARGRAEFEGSNFAARKPVWVKP